MAVFNSKCSIFNRLFSRLQPLFSGMLLAGTVLLFGCSQQPAAKHYKLAGTVLAVNASADTLTIKHEDIAGLMKGMTMDFRIKDPAMMKQLHAQDRITADLVIAGDRSWLENIRIVQAGQPQESDSSPAVQFHMPEPGETVPDFGLVGQQGKRFTLASLRGQPLLITFIYSRCPLPDYCPRMNSNFSKLLELESQGSSGPNLKLLSVSFDPEHDTPEVLRLMHAQWAHGDQSANWMFAVVPRRNLAETLKWFGLTAVPDEGIITHSLSTTLISPSGRVIAWWHDNSWKPDDVMKAWSDYQRKQSS